jgi:hypothetical protein
MASTRNACSGTGRNNDPLSFVVPTLEIPAATMLPSGLTARGTALKIRASAMPDRMLTDVKGRLMLQSPRSPPLLHCRGHMAPAPDGVRPRSAAHR